MATYSNKMFFNEKIDGKIVSDFRKLDTKKKSLDERKKILEEKLESSEFFTKYFDEVYDANLNSRDSLSDSDVVCQTLESMGTYLINCEESKQMDRKEKEEEDGNYKIFTRRLDQYIARESVSISDFDGNQQNITDSERIEFITPKNSSNKLKPKTQKITNKDLTEQTKLGAILRDYNVFLNVINNKMKKKIDSQWFLLSKHKSSVRQDMIDSKNILRGVWGYNINPRFVFKPTLSDDAIFDFTDRNTIKYLLQMPKPDLAEDLVMWIVWYEFHKTIEKAEFTTEEEVVYNLLKSGFDFKTIEEITEINYERVRKTVFDNICKKIERVKNYYDADDFEIANKIKQRKEQSMINNTTKEHDKC